MLEENFLHFKMKDTKIKICGVNDIDIAKYIYNINLDYLGLVFCTNSINIEIRANFC